MNLHRVLASLVSHIEPDDWRIIADLEEQSLLSCMQKGMGAQVQAQSDLSDKLKEVIDCIPDYYRQSIENNVSEVVRKASK